jgi:high-affinity iron transporter
MDFSPALPTFLITLREGVEAALVVGIVLACLKKADQSHLNPWVYGGIGVGLAASALVGGLLSLVLLGLEASEQPWAAVAEPLLEGSFCLVAIALLSWMLVWMTRQASTLKVEVVGQVTAALGTEKSQSSHPPGWGVAGLVFIAVFREGIETAAFILAQFQQGWLPVAGAVTGLLGATLIGVMLFQWGVRINLKRFFQVMGLALLLIVAGLVVSALKNFALALPPLGELVPAVAQWCSHQQEPCLLGPMVWDAHNFLPERQFPGIILKTLLGYREKLYLVQAIAYVAFLGILGGFYFKSLNVKPIGEVRK